MMRASARLLVAFILLAQIVLLAPTPRGFIRFLRGLLDSPPAAGGESSVQFKVLRRIPELPVKRVSTMLVRKAPVLELLPVGRTRESLFPTHMAHVGGSWTTDIVVRTEATKPSYLKFFLPLTPKSHRAPPV